MSYRCRACGKVLSTSMNLARHMMATADNFKEHVEWIESKRLSYPVLVMKGDYKALADLLEKETKVNEN